MAETFAALLIAHVAADFVLQTRWMVANKRRPAAFALHGLAVLATALLAIGPRDADALLLLTGLTLAHLAIDAVKTWGPWRGLAPFLADQAAHIAVIAALALWQPGLWATGWGAHQSANALPGAALHLALLAAGLVACARAGGFAVGLMMARYDGADLPKGLENGGNLIGLLERGLIFLMVLIGQPAGIGFLIAAKSVLRFDAASRDQTAGEYVIIGTLASFGWALAVTYATLTLAAALPPLEIAPPSP